MIDFSALGLSAANTSHHGGKRDKVGASHDHGKHAGNFDDLVNDAGKKHTKKNAADDDATEKLGAVRLADAEDADRLALADAEDGAAFERVSANNPKTGAIDIKGDFARGGKDAVNTGRNAEATGFRLEDIENDLNGLAGDMADIGGDLADVENASVDLQDLLGVEAGFVDSEDASNADLPRGESTEPDGRVRLSAAFQHLMKSNAEGGILHQATKQNPDAKTEKSEDKTGQVATRGEVPEIKEKPAATPSEELHALLGLTPESGDVDGDSLDKTDEKPAAKSMKHEATDDTTDSAAAETALADGTVAADIKADAAGLQQTAAQAAAQHAATGTAADTDLPVEANDGNAKQDSDVNAVRLVSNDGKGRPVDIELAKPANDDSSTQAGTGKTDFVNVLESRRYLGFSNDAGGNAATLTNAIKAEPSWAQVIHSVNTGAKHTATEVNTLKLQMNPENLGNMTASLRLKGEELSVEIRVETVDAYRHLSNDHDGIVKALKDQGFSIDQVSIQLSPSARTDGGSGSGNLSNGNQNQPGNGGQNLQDSGQGDTARQRDDSARRNPNQNNWMGNDRTSSFSDLGGGADDTDTGNIYI